MTYIQRDEITGARYSSSCHRRMSYLKNLVGQVVPQALPDAYKTAFTIRLDASGQQL